MKQIIFFILLVLNVLHAQSKDVLLLHSYHKGYIWSDDISKAIEKNLAKYKDIELTTLYMDTKRISSPSYLENLAKLYKQQLKKRDIDLVIASDNSAFDFAIKYHKYLFENLPIVFCGINNFDKSVLKNKTIEKFVTGVVEQVDLEKNFELILKLQPNLKNLLIINDTSKTALAIKKDLLPIIKKYQKRFKIEYIDNLNIENIKKRVKNLDKKHSAILFVLLFKDTTGKYFTYKQSFEQIKQVSKVPIYGLWDFYLNQGILGGLLTSATAQGDAVSKIVVDILHNKKDITTIPIIEKSPNAYMFNYDELKKFKISVDNVANNPIIINEPSKLYEKYTKTLLISALIIISLIIIVIILKRSINKREEIEKVLQNKVQFDKALIDTIPNPIYYKDTDGKFLGCNLAFENLVNSSADKIIGKKASDFFPKDIADKNVIIDKKVLKYFKTISFEFTLNPNSHQIKHILLNKTAYKNIDGTIGGIVCVMDDITQMVQQKQFLIQQSKLAEMGDMIAAVAHQWNEPLVELSAQVQDIQTSYLLGELQNIDVENFVNDSMVQIQYMSNTLSDFRNFLKPSTKKKLFSISKALNEINEIIGKQVFYLNIILNFHYKNPHEEILIYGYENEFKQVLLNIINNAKNKISKKHKNTNNKGKIDINIQRYENYNQIEICDDGGAIDESIIGSIFNPYFTTQVNGTGIGLYMAKVIIEDKMQGAITVKNAKNSVIFTIKIPHKVGKR